MTTKQRAQKILAVLKNSYRRTPEDFVAWKTPLELVIATVLSAQCTDKRVNMVTKGLFKKYTTAADYAEAHIETLEKEIKSTGFYHSKAKYLKGIGEMLVRDFGGKVPNTRENLMKLPGVSTKSANLVMAKYFGKNTGIAVDTHVTRLSARMGLTKAKSQDKIESDLNELFTPKEYLNVNECMIVHGRAVCTARKPMCATCPVAQMCPKTGVTRV